MRFIYSKAFAIFASCLVLVFFLALLQAKGWIDPIKRGALMAPRPVVYVVKGVTRPLKSFFSTVYRLKKIVEENVYLKQRLGEAEQQLVDYEQEKRENEALRKELGFAAVSGHSLVPCTLLSKNPFGLASDAVVLNCGAEQGVTEGQAIVSQGYLVGKIAYAGPQSSSALLVTSSRFSTDAELSKTGADAVLEGSFGAGLVLDRLSQNESVETGWLISTAGINPKIPRGILVGQVGEVISSDNDLFKKTTVLTPVDFNNLDFVFVIKP